MDHPLPRPPSRGPLPLSLLLPPSLPLPTPSLPPPGPAGGAASRKQGAAALRPFVTQIKGPERHKGSPTRAARPHTAAPAARPNVIVASAGRAWGTHLRGGR